LLYHLQRVPSTATQINANPVSFDTGAFNSGLNLKLDSEPVDGSLVNKSRKALCCKKTEVRHGDMHETLPLVNLSTHIEINSLLLLLLLLRKLNCSSR
jgi:hypothetical protein